MKQFSVLTIWLLACLGLTVACEKKSTGRNNQGTPTITGGNTGDGTNADKCLDGSQLLLATSQLPAIDASKLVVKDLVVVPHSYNNLTSSIHVAFEAPVSDKDPKYSADFGIIELVADDAANTVFYRSPTTSYSELIPVEEKWHGKKFTVRVQACAEKGRLLTSQACGKAASLPVTLPAQPAGANLTAGENYAQAINNKNLQIRINEDNRKQLCARFKGVTDEFLKNPGRTDTTEGQLVLAVAQMASYNTASFATLCSSFMIDAFYDLRKQVEQDINGLKLTGKKSGGLNLTNEECFKGESEGPTIAEMEASCNAKTGYSWNAVSQTCDMEDQGPDYAEQQTSCEAKSAEGFTWDEENKFCLKTELTVETVGTEADCSKEQGIWDTEKSLCVIKTTDVSYFEFSASINSIYDQGQCYVGTASGTVTSAACSDGAPEQLFKFETSEGKVLVKNYANSEVSCIKLGEKNADDVYSVVNDSCSEISDNHKFELKEVTYNGEPGIYWVFQSIVKDANDDYYCLEKKLDDIVSAKPCIGTADFDTKKPQLFKLSFNGGSVNIEGSGESFGYSSLVSELEDDAGLFGKLCIQAGEASIENQATVISGPLSLKLAECDGEELKQRFEAEGNSSLKTEYKASFDANSKAAQLCTDYSEKYLQVTECSETFYRQKIKVYDFKLTYAGEDRVFKRIGRDDGQDPNKCLTVDTSAADKKLSFEDCIQSSIHADLKTQLFTTVTGGGERPRYEGGAGGKQWYENVHLAEKDGWTLAGVSFLAIGVAGLATAVAPDAIRTKANQFSQWADLSGKNSEARDKWVADQSKKHSLATHGSNSYSADSVQRIQEAGGSILERGKISDISLVKDATIPDGARLPKDTQYFYENKRFSVTAEDGQLAPKGATLASDTATVKLPSQVSGIYDPKTNSVIGEIDSAKLEKIGITGNAAVGDVTINGKPVSISLKGGKLKKDLFAEFRRQPVDTDFRPDTPTRRSVRGAGGIIGVVGITLGSTILAEGAGLAQQAKVSCIDLLEKEFASLSENQRTQKMACEIGALESDLAKTRKAYDQLVNEKDELVLKSGSPEN